MKEKITSRELVKMAVKHEKSGSIPKGELVIGDDIVKSTLNTDRVTFEERFDFIDWLELDLNTLSPKYNNNLHNWSIDFENTDIEKWANTDLFTFAILDGAFEIGLRVYGFEKFLSMIMKKTLDFQEFVALIEMSNIEVAAKLADKGVDGIIIADDIAFQTGLLMRPSMFRDNFLPSLYNQVNVIDKLDMVPFFHSDGDYLAIVNDIVDSGFKGIHCIDKNCNLDLSCMEPYGDKLCLWGHLDQGDVDSSDKLENLTDIIKTLEGVIQHNGFILGTNSGLFNGMDVKKLKNIYEAVDKSFGSAL